MTDTGVDNASIRTRTDAGVPPAPRLGSSSSSSSAGAGARTNTSIAGAGEAIPRGRSTQAEARGQAQQAAIKVSKASDNQGDGLGEQDSIANSTIQSGASIPQAPPFATINLAPLVQGRGSGGGLGSIHVAAGGKTRVKMLFSAA